MDIGDRVVSRQTGLPGVGEVVGIVSYEFFISTRKNYQGPHLWDNIYCNWRNEYVIYVGYEEPRHYLSFDEFMSGCPVENISTNELKVLYKYSEKTQLITYPIADLELEV